MYASNLAKWSKAVKEKSNYTCECCGAVSGKTYNTRLEAHHVAQKTIFPDYALLIENGSALCHACHMLIHRDIEPKSIDYDRIIFTVPKGERGKIKAAADAAGESVNSYIFEAIQMRMEKSGQP